MLLCQYNVQSGGGAIVKCENYNLYSKEQCCFIGKRKTDYLKANYAIISKLVQNKLLCYKSNIHRAQKYEFKPLDKYKNLIS